MLQRHGCGGLLAGKRGLLPMHVSARQFQLHSVNTGLVEQRWICETIESPGSEFSLQAAPGCGKVRGDFLAVATQSC